MNRIAQLLSQTDSEACVLTSAENVQYLTGFTGGSAAVLLSADAAVLFTDSRYVQQARQEVDNNDVEVRVTRPGQDRLSAVAHVLAASTHRIVGLEKDDLSLADYENMLRVLKKVDAIDISDTLLRMRSIKSADEIQLIQEAARATDRVMWELAEVIHAGMSEYQICAELVYAIAKQGMTTSFMPIVAAGPNGAMPHAAVSSYIVQRGDLVTLDFGCRFRGYCADMTRTVAIGHVDGELKTIYDVVEQAQEAAESVARIGVAASQVDEAARRVIRDAGYAEYFGHGTGHGVGLQIHEMPLINSSSQSVLADSMVFTVEPGIYVEGLGGVRIEDTCVAGVGSLFSFPKKLIELH